MEDWKRPINKYITILNSTGETVEIDINVPKLRAENLHFQTWGSARILAGQLHTIPIHPDAFTPEGINILEMGAGTGLAGLAAALVWQTSLVLTDLAPFVPGLARNIEVNTDLLKQRGASASSGALDWNEPSTLSIFRNDLGQIEQVYTSDEDKAGVIIAADCLYSEDHPRMLTNAILAWLKPGPNSRVIICYPLRIAYLDIIRELWDLLEAGGLDSVSEGKEEINDEVWDDERLHEWGVWKWRGEGS
jgi:predicted nicotinamide N-methyase